MADYKLPDVGEGLTEAEIVSWKVKVGDHVEVNDVIVEIETAKSLVELPSPYAGEVSAILVDEGETVAVGTPIISIGAAAPAAAPASEPQQQPEIDLSNPAASGSKEGESLVGRMKADRGPQRRPRRGSATPTSEAGAATQMQVQGAFAAGGAQSEAVVEADEPPVPVAPTGTVPDQREPVEARVLAKPPVRKLAKDLGVDITSLVPSGPNGTVTREDVQSAASVAPEPSVPAAVQGDRREPIKGVRKAMGQAMVQSAFTLPHVTIWTTVDATRTVELTRSLRQQREFRSRELKATPLLVVAKACMLAMRRTPEVNALWDDDAQEVVYRNSVNLGIAAATPRGLLVPNIKGADALPLADLAERISNLVEVARSGKTQPPDLAGGTFTITNVGPFGMDAGTPIINPGESAILCFGAITRRPWVVTGDDGSEQIVPRDVCTLALSFDHRLIDGETGSRFLSDVAAILGDPAQALLF